MLNLIINVAPIQFVMVEDIARLNIEESKGTCLLKALERLKNSSLSPGVHMLLRANPVRKFLFHHKGFLPLS